MRVFVPVPDEWDGGASFAQEVLVPYRAGLALWHEPGSPAPAAEPPCGEVPKAA